MLEVPLTQKVFKKEALIPLAPIAIGIGALLGIFGIGSGFVAMLRGKQENIVIDSQDLLGALQDLKGDFTNSDHVVDEMITNAQQLVTLCQQLYTHIGSGDKAAAGEVQGNIMAADMAVDIIERDFQVLVNAENMGQWDQQKIGGHISDLRSSMSGFVQALGLIGEQIQRSKVDLDEQTSENMEQQNFPTEVADFPRPTQNYPLSEQEKAQVAMFLNQNGMAGTTLNNLSEQLYELAGKMTQSLGVDNITGERLATADVTKLRRLFEIWRNPGSVMGYT